MFFTAGFLYLLFNNEKAVRNLLLNCNQDTFTKKWYFTLSSSKIQNKRIQVGEKYSLKTVINLKIFK